MAYTWKLYSTLECRFEAVQDIVVIAEQLETLAHAPPELYCRVYDDAPVTAVHESDMLVVNIFVGLLSTGAAGSVHAVT